MFQYRKSTKWLQLENIFKILSYCNVIKISWRARSFLLCMSGAHEDVLMGKRCAGLKSNDLEIFYKNAPSGLKISRVSVTPYFGSVSIT